MATSSVPWDGQTQFQGGVELDDMKFNAAHFIAYRGFREPLHGHNYRVAVAVGGNNLQADGYLVDFSVLKRAARSVCDRLNHRTLLPLHSDVLRIVPVGGPPPHVEVACEDSSRFTFPASDCVLLPVAHTTTEELALHMWSEILDFDGLRDTLIAKGSVTWLEVGVSERVGQGSRYRNSISATPSMPSRVPVAKDNAKPDESSLFFCQPCEDQAPASSTSVSTTPTPGPAIASIPADDDKAVVAFRMLLSSLGEGEANRPEVAKTPARAAKAWRELNASCFLGDPKKAVGEGVFPDSGHGDLVTVRDMTFQSLCEHHLLPVWGTAHVAYVPSGRVLGLSKFPRLLHAMARRPTLQERLTRAYAETLDELLHPEAVLVVIQANHACMCLRGVGMPALTRTMAFRGKRKDDPAIRNNLLTTIGEFGTGTPRL